MRIARTALVLMTLLAAATALRAQAPQPQRFDVPLSRPGQAVRLKVSLIGGSISVVPHGGSGVIVEAVPGNEDDHGRGPAAGGMRRSPNRSLGLVVEEENNQVTIGMGDMPSDVTLRIHVPRQTSVVLSTVNDGELHVEGLEGTLELSNTNGGITALNVAGSVVAHTTNGDVKVTMTRVDAPLAFASFNGDVDVTLPASTRGAVRMRSDKGEIYTDFDIALTSSAPKVQQRRGDGKYRLESEQDVNGTLNGGGPNIQLRTFNGNIFLRRK